MTEAVQALTVRRTISAGAQDLFDAWTRPERLVRWWGPVGVKCPSAEVDLRPEGAYRIGNEFPDGRVVWISGRFVTVEPPHLLQFTWRIEGDDRAAELVSVHFETVSEKSTEVVVVHERIATEAARDSHEVGWMGCLEGLAAYSGS